MTGRRRRTPPTRKLVLGEAGGLGGGEVRLGHLRRAGGDLADQHVKRRCEAVVAEGTGPLPCGRLAGAVEDAIYQGPVCCPLLVVFRPGASASTLSPLGLGSLSSGYTTIGTRHR